MLELFQEHCAAAIAQHEAVAVLVPRTAGFLGCIVARGKRLRLAEAAEPTARCGHLAAAGNDDVRISILNGAHAEPDSMGRGRAGGDDAEVWALQAVANREMPRDHVDD